MTIESRLGGAIEIRKAADPFVGVARQLLTQVVELGSAIYEEWCTRMHAR